MTNTQTHTQLLNVLPVNSQSQREVLCFWCIQFWIGPQGWLVGLGVLKCSSRTLLSAKHKFWEKTISNDKGIKHGNRKCNKQTLRACAIISNTEMQTWTTKTPRLKWLRGNSPLLHPSRFSEYLGFSVSFLYINRENNMRLRLQQKTKSVDSTDLKKQHSAGKVENEGEWKHLWHGRVAAFLFCDHKNATKTCHVLV